MLTKLTIRNFKQFDSVEVDLGNPVVFIGPNNSGKTTALQALALWDIGLRRWIEKRGGKKAPEKRPGVTINRRDLTAIPVADTNLLWRDLHVRDLRKVGEKTTTSNVCIEITLEGVTDGVAWTCGLEFDYANNESLYCRPLRVAGEKGLARMPIPEQATGVRVAFLGPMSGLAANELRLDPGAISVRLGEGRTAEVLRNLCYQVLNPANGEGNARKPSEQWAEIRRRIESLFGEVLEPPRYVPERGELEMGYRTRSGRLLDLASAGRGLQQTLLLLAHLNLNPHSVLLIDEPDAHLEILRQRQIYRVLTDMASELDSQVIIASHSEVVLNEAADRHVVVAFVGRQPHRIDDRGSQVLKSLKEIGFDQYYQAEQTGWLLYLEGSTDLEILRAFAAKLQHPALGALDRPFVCYVGNQPRKAQDHFFGLQEAKRDLVAFALFDRIDGPQEERDDLRVWMWKKREIENYLCLKDVLVTWAEARGESRAEIPLLGSEVRIRWRDTMLETIGVIEDALANLNKDSPWSADAKVTDDFLDPLFEAFYKNLQLPNMMRKTSYHELARFVPRDRIDPEVVQVLDLIHEVKGRASPAP
jgi:predicted ATPase